MGRDASPLLGLGVKDVPPQPVAAPHVLPPVERRGNDVAALVAVAVEFREVLPETHPMIVGLD